MASAEVAGPRFAPEDPTLPKPWKGLIDGSTGILYYWNPETNVTQYEKPSGSAPPLPPGPPPLVSTLNPAPGSMDNSLPSNSSSTALQPSTQQVVEQTGQHMQQQQLNQSMLQQKLQTGHQVSFQQLGQQAALQHAQQMPYHNQQLTQHQAPQQYPQLQPQQMPYQQTSYVQGQIAPRPQSQQQQMFQFTYQQGQQPQAVQMSYQQGQQSQGLQIQNQQKSQESLLLHNQPQAQGSQIPLSEGLQMSSQQSQHSVGLQITHQKAQQLQGLTASSQHGQQPIAHQVGLSRLEKANHQDGKPDVFSLPGSVPQISFQQGSNHIIQPPQQLGRPSLQNSSSMQLQQVGTDPSYHQKQLGVNAGPNQLGHSMIRPSMTPKMGFNEAQPDRSVNETYSSGKVQGSMMFSQHPKLAALPVGHNQDARLSHQFVPSGGSGGINIGLQHPLSSMYNHTAFPNSSVLRPSIRMHGSSGFPNVSAADAYRQRHEVTATGEDVPAPFMTFEATGFPPEILREMHLAGFTTPTPIQAQTWPVALQNRDIVAIAKTGSGKTLGYLVPAFMLLRRCRNNPQFGPTVLVLAPTRELASQIQDEALKFGRSSRFSCVCIYGGAPKGPQLKEIERGADIVVATPGRLNDLLEMRKINFRQITLLVLDEADRMLDMGFEPQIRKIVNEIPPQRQTLMYTATWPKEVRKIAGDLLRNPVQVNIGSVDELAANKSITQYVEVVAPMDRQRRLEQILRTQERGSKIIIFCSTKRLCDQLARSIGRTFGAAAIHGDKSQGERDHVLNQFRTGRAPILVATDVAARGLDIKDIRVVINYDFPTGIEDYVHRIGRTGRAGATGVSYTFFSDQDSKYAADLVKVLEGASQHVPPEIRGMAERGGSLVSQPRGGMNRWDSGGGGSRWEFNGGRDMRDRPDGPGGFGGRGGRNDFVGGRGLRGRGFGGPGGPGGRGWRDRGPHDRYMNQDVRSRYDGHMGPGFRNKDKSYRSPERVRTWGYSKSRSRSRSWSRSRSPGSSRNRSGSRSCWSRSRSRSRSFDRSERPQGRDYGRSSGAVADHDSGFRARRRSGFDELPPAVLGFEPQPVAGFEPPPVSAYEPQPVAGFGHQPVAGFQPPQNFEPPLLSCDMSPMSPAGDNGSLSENEPVRFGFSEPKNVLGPVER